MKWFVWVLTGVTLGLLLAVLWQPIDGEFASRQVIVQANIEKLLSGADLLAPGTYNLQRPPLMYDFPLYQWLVSGLSQVLSVDPLVVARLLSFTLFVVGLFVFDALLAAARCPRLQRALALVLVASSPLQLHNYTTPMIDCLAITLSLMALWAFVCLEGDASGRAAAGWTALMATAGFTAALIKCPVLLPVALAVAFHVVARDGWRALLNRSSVLLGTSCLLGFFVYLAVRDVANGGERIVNQNPTWLFGTIEGHFNLENWSSLGRSAGLYVLAFPMTLLALAAWAGSWRHSSPRRGEAHWLWWGWAFGCLAYVLVFFHLHWKHSYYQLPLVYPAAYFGASALVSMFRWGSARLGRVPAAWVGLVVLGGVVASGARELTVLRAPTVAVDQARGDWLQEYTRPSDFVVFVTESSVDTNNAPLYFAQRDGCNLGIMLIEAMSPSTTLGWVVEYIFPRARSWPTGLHVYAPPALIERVDRVIGASPLFRVEECTLGGRLYSFNGAVQAPAGGSPMAVR